MTDTQLTALSTFAWLIGTITLFILLAHWSAGGSWGFAAAVVRGLTGWSGNDAGGRAPRATDLRPMQTPELARLWGALPQARGAPIDGVRPQAAASDQANAMVVIPDNRTVIIAESFAAQPELVDLGVRRIDQGLISPAARLAAGRRAAELGRPRRPSRRSRGQATARSP